MGGNVGGVVGAGVDEAGDLVDAGVDDVEEIDTGAGAGGAADTAADSRDPGSAASAWCVTAAAAAADVPA